MSNWGFKDGVHDTVVSPENVTVEGGSICAVHERIIAGYFRMVEMFVFLMMKTTIRLVWEPKRQLQREHRFYRTRNECFDSTLYNYYVQFYEVAIDIRSKQTCNRDQSIGTSS